MTTEVKPEKGRRGFASMDRDRHREIASKGGKAAHAQGRAHQFTSEEARLAGYKGGIANARRASGADTRYPLQFAFQLIPAQRAILEEIVMPRETNRRRRTATEVNEYVAAEVTPPPVGISEPIFASFNPGTINTVNTAAQGGNDSDERLIEVRVESLQRARKGIMEVRDNAATLQNHRVRMDPQRVCDQLSDALYYLNTILYEIDFPVAAAAMRGQPGTSAAREVEYEYPDESEI